MKDQSALEAEWVKWAEQESAKDNAAERKAKRDAAKATGCATDRARCCGKVTKPSIATFSPANPFASGQMTTTNVLDGYEKARKEQQGASSSTTPKANWLARFPATSLCWTCSVAQLDAGQWRYRGSEAPGGLLAYGESSRRRTDPGDSRDARRRYQHIRIRSRGRRYQGADRKGWMPPTFNGKAQKAENATESD